MVIHINHFGMLYYFQREKHEAFLEYTKKKTSYRKKNYPSKVCSDDFMNDGSGISVKEDKKSTKTEQHNAIEEKETENINNLFSEGDLDELLSEVKVDENLLKIISI